MSVPADMLFQRTFWLMAGAGSALLVMPRAADEVRQPCTAAQTA